MLVGVCSGMRRKPMGPPGPPREQNRYAQTYARTSPRVAPPGMVFLENLNDFAKSVFLISGMRALLTPAPPIILYTNQMRAAIYIYIYYIYILGMIEYLALIFN